MGHLVFFYDFVCYSAGALGLLFAVLTAVVRRSLIDRRYAAFMFSFTVILVSESAAVYSRNAGVETDFFSIVRTLIECAGGSLIIATLPRFIHSLMKIPFERTLNRLFVCIAVFSYLIPVAGLLRLPLSGPSTPYYALITATILYAVSAGNFFSRRWPNREASEAEMARWGRLMGSVSILTVAFVPLFVVLDFFPQLLPVISSRLPSSFRSFPAFYLIWNLLYIGHTLPSHYRHGRQSGEEEWDFDRFALSPREREVTALLLEGLAYREIALKLSVSLATVKTHVNRIYDKTGAGNKIELSRMLRGS
jgi:DNA-binding CsgD family transcriptional regulator